MTAVRPGTTLARSAALARALDATTRAHEEGCVCECAVAVRVAVDGLLTLARQGHGAPVIERILADVADVLGITEED